MGLLEKYTIQHESEFVFVKEKENVHIAISGGAKRSLRLPGRRVFI